MFDALDALAAMEDPSARARAISAFLRQQQKRIKVLSELRREYVLAQRALKVPHRTLAAELGVSLATIQDIERGYSGSGRSRPRTTGKAKNAGEDKAGNGG
ncbi:hypothetical protein [Actinacidiphila sp. ITFR-21]|uniref:hypothetical protein n=1 Tax=Actinacidiphila sp. ITFR-21 TaxID=3075199 RepID=UPI00288A3D9E|nr:hypothetical protein [Streptomyces sp. ITFR-21]WNI20357.1 hypothetical protein RLT57_32660 [Streptomyces sp. ITFR-21]